MAQHIIRNPFSEQKMTYNEENGTVIYRSRMRAKKQAEESEHENAFNTSGMHRFCILPSSRLEVGRYTLKDLPLST